MAWVVGRGGNLGSRLAKLLEQGEDVEVWGDLLPRFSWEDPPALEGQIERAVRGFAGAIEAPCHWVVLWAAGSGVVASVRERLVAETATLCRFLELLRHHVRPSDGRSGMIFLASSAGGVYGGSAQHLITEQTAPAPVSEYGRQKLAQEQLLLRFVDSTSNILGVIGRISNLYGEEQNLAKPQGLLSHMSRCLVWNRPIHIYVPLDTTRDYLYVGDCAASVVGSLWAYREKAARGPTPRTAVKLFASERTTTIAEVVTIFARIAKKQPRIVCSASALAPQQPRHMRMRSEVLREANVAPGLTLLEGIQRLHGHHLARYRDGRLPEPPGYAVAGVRRMTSATPSH